MGYKLEQNKNMKLTIPYYLHKAGAGFPSPATRVAVILLKALFIPVLNPSFSPDSATKRLYFESVTESKVNQNVNIKTTFCMLVDNFNQR